MNQLPEPQDPELTAVAETTWLLGVVTGGVIGFFVGGIFTLLLLNLLN